MAITNLSIPTPQVTTLGDAISGGLKQGTDLATALQNIRTAQSKIPLTKAQTALAQAKAQQALQGPQFKPGTLGEVTTSRLYAKHMKDTFGPNSPQYLNALQDLHLTQAKVKSGIERQEALTAFLPIRGLTAAGKSAIQEANTRTGFAPTGETWQQQVGAASRIRSDPIANALLQTAPFGQPGQLQQPQAQPQAQPQVSQTGAPKTVKTQFGDLPAAPGGIPPGSEALANQFALERIKATTDPDTRQRLRFATNVDKSFKFLNKTAPNALSYSHPGGIAELGKDMAQAAHSNTSQRYQDYIDFNKSLHFLKEQMIQFYNLSKQPEKGTEILKMLNTISFTSNPKQAMNTLKWVEKVYGAERKTFVKAVSDPAIYKSQGIDLSKDLDQQFKAAKAPTQDAGLSQARGMSNADLLRIARGGQ